MKRARLRQARAEARRLLVDLGVREPEHIDPIETAKELGVEVTFGHLERATARVYRIGNRAARIRVSDAVMHPGRRRFSIAHEIGHIVLGHELPRDPMETGATAIRPVEDEQLEREADAFAAEHLTPEDMVRPYCNDRVGLEATHRIASTFTVSPVAAAIRYVELTSSCCALVYCEAGNVKWATRSALFPWHLPLGMVARDGTAAGHHRRVGQVPSQPITMPSTAWLPYVRGPAMDIVEHAEYVPEPNGGGVMSLLWIPERCACAPT